MFLFDGGFIPVKRAENYCDMINVFTPYPLEGNASTIQKVLIRHFLYGRGAGTGWRK